LAMRTGTDKPTMPTQPEIQCLPHERGATPWPAKGAVVGPAGTLPAPPQQNVYEELVGRILPRMLHRFESMPCIGGDLERWIGRSADLDAPHAALSAALTMICVEPSMAQADSAFVPVRVQSALTTWQLRLRSDGSPRARRLFHDPSLLVGARLVVTILTEASRYHNASLLADLKAHLTWLGKRKFVSCRHDIQCAAILVVGALLLRDRGMLESGRARLGKSLGELDRRGWMEDARVLGVWQWCQVMDAIAPLYRVLGWSELHRPLESAFGVLERLVHPDGRIPHAKRFPLGLFCSPLSPELLADHFPTAASLAGLCRGHCRELLAGNAAQWSDRQSIDWAPKLALAGLHASVTQPKVRFTSVESRGHAAIEEVGVITDGNDSYHAEIHVRCGGKLRVTWRDGKSALSDDGLLLVHKHRVRVPAGRGGQMRCSVTAASVNVFGTLRRTPHHSRRLRALLIGGRRTLRQLGFTALGRIVFGSLRMARLRRRLSPDRYWREIRLGDDWVSIRDVILSRQRFDSVVIRIAARIDASIEPNAPVDQAHLVSLSASGGCRVVITRVYKRGALVECSSSVDPPKRIFKARRAPLEAKTTT